MLAGDALKSAADLGLSLAGIGILWNKGYFKQKFWFRSGGQAAGRDVVGPPAPIPGLVPLDPKIETQPERPESGAEALEILCLLA